LQFLIWPESTFDFGGSPHGAAELGPPEILSSSFQLALRRWQVHRWPMGRLKAAFSLQYRRLVQDEACCQCGRASKVLKVSALCSATPSRAPQPLF